MDFRARLKEEIDYSGLQYKELAERAGIKVRALFSYTAANPSMPPADVAARLDGVESVAALELNVSCPNVKEGGHTFGQNPDVLENLVKAVRAATKKPLIVKLAPNVPDFAP